LGPTQERWKNGAVYDHSTGRIVANPGGGTAAFTAERVSALKQARQQKAAELLRLRITEKTEKKKRVKLEGSAEAVALVGGLLWEEIVLNSKKYPRDRLEAFVRLGNYAGVLPDQRDADPAAGVDSPVQIIGALTELTRALREVMESAPRELSESD
jgi:hypothetical protein